MDEQLEKDLENFRRNPATKHVPNVPFEMIEDLKLENVHWAQLMLEGDWTFVTAHLNDALEHGVFENTPTLIAVCNKINRPHAVRDAGLPSSDLRKLVEGLDRRTPYGIRAAMEAALEMLLANEAEAEGIPGPSDPKDP